MKKIIFYCLTASAFLMASCSKEDFTIDFSGGWGGGVFTVEDLKLLDLGVLLSVGPDDADAGQIFLSAGRDVGEKLLNLLKPLVDPRTQKLDRQRHQRHRDEQQQRQPHRDVEHDRQRNGDRKSTRLNSSHHRLSRMPSSA